MIDFTEFYYDEAQSGNSFTPTPTSSFDVNRMIAGKPAWYMTALPREPKSKKLIVADWTVANWTDDKRAAMTTALTELLAKGFQVYAWNHGKLQPLSKKSTASTLKTLSSRPVIPEDIFKAAVLEKINRDQLHILDDYWTEQLCHPEEKIERQLKVSDYLSISSEGDRKKICNALRQAQPPLTTIVIDAANPTLRSKDKKKEEIVSSLKDALALPNIKTKQCFIETTADQMHLTDPQPVNDELLLDVNEVQITGLPKASGKKPPYDLTTLMTRVNQCYPKLEKLKLAGEGFFSKAPPDSSNQPQLPQVEELDLSKATLLEAQILALTNSMPNLRKIKIPATSIDKGFIGSQERPQLEEISFFNTRVTERAIKNLITKAPNLKRISLKGVKGLTLRSNDPKWLKLEELNLSTSDITQETLDTLLSMAPSLKKINLLNLEEIFPTKQFEWKYSTQLEEIDFSNSSVNSMYLQSFIDNNRNLKKINVQSCDKLVIADINWGKLSQLEEIMLSGANLSPKNLNGLIDSAPLLKKISLAAFQNLDDPTIAWDKLSQLEEIEFLSNNIHETGLKKLVNNNPYLKKISLYGCKNFTNLEIDWSKLSQLEEIDLSDTNISATNLKALIENAPHLKTMNLSHCKGLTDSNIDWSQLSQLENITLDEDQALIRQVLDNAPNLSSTCRADLEGQRLRIERPRAPSQSQDTLPPAHNPQAMMNHKPAGTGAPFKFTNRHPPNQAMIIEKLSQYLILNNKDTYIISKMQDGICNALSQFFIDKGTDAWNEAMESIKKWAGTTPIPEDIGVVFEELTTYVKQRHLQQTEANQFLGANLAQYLDSLAHGGAAVLKNPWHAIAVRRIDSNTYEIYDPNHTAVLRVQADELKSKMTHLLGTLVQVESNDTTLAPSIINAEEFIRDGGLLSLCGCKNIKPLLITLLEAPLESIPKEALQGLLLRNMMGVPAWVSGMHHPHPQINTLTQKLVRTFKELHTNAETLLSDSKQDMEPTPLLNLALREKIIKATSAPVAPLRPSPQLPPNASPPIVAPPSATPNEPLLPLEVAAPVIPEASTFDSESAQFREELLSLFRTPHKKHYQQQLTTWETTENKSKTLNEYCQQTLRDDENIPTRLIECTASETLDGLSHKLQAYCGHTSRPVFYIDKPEDLICSAPFLFENETSHTAELRKGPGGPLYDFLIKHKAEKPVLLVNYANFHADDIVRFNGLLDTIPQADGTLLPAQTTVIGLTNTSDPDCYQGADFYSRFKEKERQTFSSDILKPKLSPVITAPEGTEKTVINLYHAPDWEARLLGSHVIEGGVLQFEEGELQKALRKGGPIEIQNGFWGETDFDRFWQQLRQAGVRHAGRTIRIPESTVIYKHQGYDWTALKQSITAKPSETFSPDHPTLNMSSLPTFLGTYELEKGTTTLTNPPGLIASAPQGRVLQINVTAPLTDDAWAMLLTQCQQQGVTLQAHCAPGVTLPKDLGYEPTEAPPLSAWAGKTDAIFEVIVSNDVDTTVHMLTQGETDWKVIDISEVQAHDLLMRLDGALNQDNMQLEFTEKEGALLQALKNREKVLLKGDFSEALTDALAPLLIQQAQTPSNHLRLVTTKASPFTFLNATVTHKVTPKDKLNALGKPFSTDQLKKYPPKESLSQFKARNAYLTLHPDGNSDDAWKGMMHLPGGVNVANTPLGETTTEDAEAFTKARKDAVTAVLKESPCVFLTGLSGVGKTTFIHNELCPKDSHYELFNDEHQIAAWAQAKANPGKTLLLFLDEANLSHRNWSEFEGLFQSPPGMLIDGTFHPLSPHHKVVFAGNPASYGDERKLAPFFQRHGAAVLFEPLPNAIIYEKIIKPVFSGMNDLSLPEMQRLSQPILDAYAFICQSSPKEMLISPRELQMMVLLACSNAQNNKDVSLEDHLKQSVYRLGQSLLPASNKEAQAQFEEQFKPAPTPTTAPKAIGDGFLITPSRHPIMQALQERLQLREWRQVDKSLNDDQKYGGIGGVVLEGAPGIGKSELAIQVLLDAGYQEEQEHTQPSQHDKPFYRLPVTMEFAAKKALLGKIFDEGGVVIIDEMNSCPMMEQFLNALLMGRNPDNNNQRPQTPGFMIIGTQNPISMAGRRAASTALSRRITHVDLPDYTPEEIQNILIQKSIDPLDAAEMTEAFFERRAYAQKNNFDLPCFRDLLKMVENERLAIQARKDSFLKKNCHELIDETNRILSNLQHAPWKEAGTKLLLEISQLPKSEACSGDQLITLHSQFFAKKMQVTCLVDKQQQAIAAAKAGAAAIAEAEAAAAAEANALNELLKPLKQKTEGIPLDKSPHIRGAADTLLTALQTAIQQYATTPTKTDRVKAFNNACEEAINNATPILEKELGWGSFLRNLMKKLANGIAQIFVKEVPFSMETTEHTKTAKTALQALKGKIEEEKEPSKSQGPSST